MAVEKDREGEDHVDRLAVPRQRQIDSLDVDELVERPELRLYGPPGRKAAVDDLRKVPEDRTLLEFRVDLVEIAAGRVAAERLGDPRPDDLDAEREAGLAPHVEQPKLPQDDRDVQRVQT